MKILSFLQDFEYSLLLEYPYKHYILTIIAFVCYYIYWRKFSKYVCIQAKPIEYFERTGSSFIPGFPNGWYRLYDSDELKVGQVKYKKCLGENLVVFRGTNNKVYCLDAFCLHMGANMGKAGKLKKDTCVECQFHGWMYDGETGNCIGNNGQEAKVCDIYEYHNIEQLESDENGTFFKNTGSEAAKLRKWIIKERDHQIYIWYHPEEEHRLKPLYDLLDLKDYKHLEYRGFGLNCIKNHIQETLENTVDYLHFHYVHGQFITGSDILRFIWFMRWKKAEDPTLIEQMKCDDPVQDSYRKLLISRFINDENRKHVSMIGLENHFHLPWLGFSHYTFTATAVNLGSNLVYFFFRSWFYDVVFIVSCMPIEKYEQHFVVTVFTTKRTPYFITAYVIYFETGQILNDGVIWDHKVNPTKLYYNKFGPYEKMFIEWRNFYARFFKGSYEKEKKTERLAKNKLDW